MNLAAWAKSILLSIATLAGCATAQPPQPVAPTPPAIPSAEEAAAPDSPASTDTPVVPSEPQDAPPDAPVGHDDLDQLLDRIEARAEAIRTLHARLRYTTVQGLLGDEQIRFGELWYAAPRSFPQDGPAATAERLAVHLQRENIDGRIVPANQWLIFDGDWFLDRDESTRRATRRGLRPLDDAADNPAAALPVPIRLNRAQAQQTYDITQRDDADRPGDAPAGITLDFKPKPGVDAQAVCITFDPDSLLPVDIRFGDPDGDLTVFRLVETQPNPDGLERDLFDTALPTQPGWDNQLVPFGE